MNIGEASGATGVWAKMIRYYEETGLITFAQRSAADYRVYAENYIQTLRINRRAGSGLHGCPDQRPAFVVARPKPRKF